MSSYRRSNVPGGTYFFTVVTFKRRRFLCDPDVRDALRAAINRVPVRYPFCIDAWVLLPDHLHVIWTLPEGDCNFSLRWQRRYWEHQIRSEEDFQRHVDYLHFNPVRHGLVERVDDWPFSSFHRYRSVGVYGDNWARDASSDRLEYGDVD